MMSKYNVLLIGLGRIGALYDLEVPGEKSLSHLRAILNNPAFNLVGLVDPAPAKHKTVQEHTDLTEDLFFRNHERVNQRNRS